MRRTLAQAVAKKSGKKVKKGDPWEEYREGASGLIAWANENVCVPIYPEGEDIAEWCLLGELPTKLNPITNRSYMSMWKAQQEILKEALVMEDGRFKHRLIVFCWPRGEGKSLLVCIIKLWRFFCWTRQQIMLGANSKDQVKFVHYDIMRDIIVNSPALLDRVGGKRNIQEKEIRLKDSNNNVKSLIRSISSFSGIVSNITGFTFSEIFDMKNPKFYTQLYGSIRNMPNALGVIDSTVSAKTHILYQLYHNYVNKISKNVYFSYRFSREGRQEDYWNPLMTNSQLNDYRVSFLFGDFERYFLNLWEAGQVQAFTEEMLEETYMLGADGQLLNHNDIQQAVNAKFHFLRQREDFEQKKLVDGVVECDKKIIEVESRFTPVSKHYELKNRAGEFLGNKEEMMVEVERIVGLGDLLDTDWALLCGLDMGDPLAVRGLARSVLTITLKGLPRSRSDRALQMAEISSLHFLYFIIGLYNIENHDLNTIKDILDVYHTALDGIDTFCCERFAAWDMEKWCEDRSIEFEPIFPNYDRQREAFKELYIAVREGRLKAPPIPVAGSKQEDMFREEARMFYHNKDERWFGSIEKSEKYGIQDDSIYSEAWCLYGGRKLGPMAFRPRKSVYSFGFFVPNKALAGNY